MPWSRTYYRLMTRKPNQRHAVPRDPEIEQPAPENPLDENGQEKARRPRWRSVFHRLGRGAGAAADTIVETLPL